MIPFLEGVSRLVVDGNNVMGARPDGWWRDRPAAARRLVDALGLLAAGRGVVVTVVFDGRVAEGDDPPGVDVRVATRKGRDAADDDIAAFVAAAPRPDDLLVVTADRALRARAEEVGARVAGPSALLAALDDAGDASDGRSDGPR